jgi:hypothetical protein
MYWSLMPRYLNALRQERTFSFRWVMSAIRGKGSEAATKCHATAINLSQQRFQKKLAAQSIQKSLNRPGANSV